MLVHKHITKIVAVITAITVCLCLVAMIFAENISAAMGGPGVTMEYETALFDTSEIISVNIIMDEDEWQDMLDNAMSEVYYQCDVEINGKMFYRVGIRPKGNTSLSSIANDPNTDRYSFKLEFDRYVDGQTCFGLDKLVLNNNYADATNMKEALIYDMYAYLGADVSLYNYAEISVNGEYWGVYLALEAVEDSFLLRNYGVRSGELYKPDSMNMGGGVEGGDRGNMDFGNMDFGSFGSERPGRGDGASEGGTDESAKPDMSNMPSTGEMPDMSEMFGGGGMGGFSMGGGGANLNYTDDSLDSYSTIWEGEVTGTSNADHKRVVTALKNISDGTDLETYMDIDNLLKYMAVHLFSVNDDSLSGSMAHNYYLYEEDGALNIIPWDYNLAFGGMGMGGSSGATSMVNQPIDDAFSSTRFFDTLMENEEYHAQYYAVMQKLVEEYLLGDGFENFYNRTRAQIDALVEADPNAFYTYEEYLVAVETLYELVKLRGESIGGQVSGTIPSTVSEQRNSDALIDASHLDLSVLGSMSMGGGFGGRGSFDGKTNETDREASDAVISNTSTKKTATEGDNMPDGFDPSQMGDNMPDGFDPSQFGGNIQGGTMSTETGKSTQSGEKAPSNSERPSSGSQNNMQNNFQNNGPSFDRNNISDRFSGGAVSVSLNNWITYGICFGVLIGALVFVKLYHRKARRR